MEVRVVRVNNLPEAPFSGSGMVVVVEANENVVRLLYPMTLDEWSMPFKDRLNQHGVVDREGFINSTEDVDVLWPENKSTYQFDPLSLADKIRTEIQRQWLYGVNRPTKADRGTLVKVLTWLRGIPEEEVDADLRQLQDTTVPIQKPVKAPKPKQQKLEGENMAKKEKKPSKASGHRENVLYLATPKLDADKFRGQRKAVAKALGAYSTPKSLEDLVKKVEAGGEYKVAAAGGITDSVHFHLRELVKEGLVKEDKIEAPAKEATA